MKKNKLDKILTKNFPRLKKMSYSNSSDLIKQALLDSLELIKLLTILEKKHNFNLKQYQKKNNNFMIKNIEKFIK